NFFAVHMGYQGAALAWVEDLLHRELKHQHNLAELAEEINRSLRDEVKLVLLDLLYQIAYAEFELHVTEEGVLREVALLLQISSTEEGLVRRRHMGGHPSAQSDEDYLTLGLLPGATQEEIKFAYRTLVKKFHPDVVSHLGSEFKVLSEEKMKALTEAYNRLYKVS
ncbi:MAG: DnaJ domain-containing protein, partial [Candidatus Margulisiibacteriota bacterium]